MFRLMKLKPPHGWSAVAWELAIVTLGVLIAFQVQQWGNDFSRARDEHEFLERLYRETANSQRELVERIHGHQRGVDELGAALRAKHDPALLEAYAKHPQFGCIIGTLPSAAYNETTSEELIASGRISTISDPKLRDTVRQMAASQANGERQLAYGRESVNSVIALLLPYYRNELREGEDDLSCTIDWPGLFASPAAATALARAYRVQAILLSNRKETLAATNKARRELACKLHQPECRAT